MDIDIELLEEPVAEELLAVEEEQRQNPTESTESNNKSLNRTSVVVFRDRVLKVVEVPHTTFSNWFVYDYYSAPNTDIGTLFGTNYVFMMENYNKGMDIDPRDNAYKGISPETFLAEAEKIAESDVPMRLMDCLLNIQQRKVAPSIPYKKLLEHEEHHLTAMKCEIDVYLKGLIPAIYAALEKSNVSLEVIAYPFIAVECNIKNGCKIFYKYPNADGKVRPNFQQYASYLFEKLFPRPCCEGDVELDATIWIQSTLCAKLVERYPFMQINYVGAPNYIEIRLPTEKILH